MKCIAKVQRFEGGQNYLLPAYASDAETFAKLKRGNYYKAVITKARNPDHHRKGMRLIRDVFENQDTYKTFEDLLVEFKLRTGWYDEHITSAPTSPALAKLVLCVAGLPAPIRTRVQPYLKALEKEATVVYVPKSIDFENMDQTTFDEFYKRAIDVALEFFGYKEAREYAGYER